MAIWRRAPSNAERRGALRLIERLLLVVGVICLGYYAFVSAEAALYQAYETRQLEAVLASRDGAPAPEAPALVPDAERNAGRAGDAAAGGVDGDARDAGPAPRQPDGDARAAADAPARPARRAPRATRATAPAAPALGAVGRIEIPRLGVSAIIGDGTDARTLRRAVGHIPGTATPGHAGNVGLAAHRDTFFKRLGDIEPGDVVRVITPEGTFTYHVRDTLIVEPEDVWVLDPTQTPAVTLVTCYPFSFFGSAPQRFIVRAELANR